MASTLGKAFVQIVPSAQGISGSISKVLDPEAKNAGQTSGQNIAQELVSKIKGFVAAAGIGTFISNAISAGGDLEQSIGGIETLFGNGGQSIEEYAQKVGKSVSEIEDEYNSLTASQERMFEYANKAYKDAGLSANDYMQTVSGFAASLKQSVGGDLETLTSVANQAVIDMSDNANKMGTSMENIQNAYQGFAKQNYTMLDNLKLGYGGTKTEMERLLEDASKLSGVEYNIDNLSDVYTAIHVIQTELGITGTTAKEAASTLSGSFNTMGSAFKDFMANLALGNDISEPMANLVEATSAYLFGNLIPMVINIAANIPGALVQGIQTAIPKIYDGVVEIISGFTTYMDENFASIITSGFDLLNEFINGILTNLPSFTDTVGGLIFQFINTIVENFPLFVEKGSELVMNLIQGVINNLPQIVSSALTLLMNFIKSIVTNLPQIVATGIKMVTELKISIVNAIPNLFRAVVDGFKSMDWLRIGSDIISGIINGLLGGIGTLIDAAVSVARSAWDAITGFFDINSPSKKMMWAAEMVDTGFAKGLTDNSDKVAGAMNSLSEDTFSSFVDIPKNMTFTGAASDNSMMISYLEQLIDIIEKYSDDLSNLKIVLDDGTIVGKLSGKLNKSFEKTRLKEQRGL